MNNILLSLFSVTSVASDLCNVFADVPLSVVFFGLAQTVFLAIHTAIKAVIMKDSSNKEMEHTA